MPFFLWRSQRRTLATPTVQAKDGTALDNITWSGTIRIESQNHYMGPDNSSHPPETDTSTLDRTAVSEYQGGRSAP